MFPEKNVRYRGHNDLFLIMDMYDSFAENLAANEKNPFFFYQFCSDGFRTLLTICL